MGATATTRAMPAVPPLAAPLACGACLLAGAAYVAANEPGESGTFLACPFRALTGLWCPGCGLTRASHHLFRGDVVQALRFNVFVVAMLAALTLAWLCWALAAVGRRYTVRLPLRVQIVAGSALMAFAVVRNLPGVPGLRG